MRHPRITYWPREAQQRHLAPGTVPIIHIRIHTTLKSISSMGSAGLKTDLPVQILYPASEPGIDLNTVQRMKGSSF